MSVKLKWVFKIQKKNERNSQSDDGGVKLDVGQSAELRCVKDELFGFRKAQFLGYP